MTSVVRPGDAWAVDEVGLAFGVLGDYRVRTVYQPVFERRGGMLVPVAVSASAELHRAGRALGPVQGTSLLDFAMRRAAGRLEAELAVRNYPNIGCEDVDLDLIVPLDGTTRLDETALADLLAIADEADVPRHRLRFDITAVVASLGAPIDVGGVPRGAFVADVAAAAAWPQALADNRPGVVRLTSGTSRMLMEDDVTLRLLPALSRAIARQGGALQVDGISSQMLLRRALAAGCPRLQGDFLAPAALAGTEFDPAPRPVETLIGVGGVQMPA